LASGERKNGGVLELESPVRTELWGELVQAIEHAIERTEDLPVVNEQDAEEVRRFVGQLDFETPLQPIEALRFAVEGLSRYTVNFHSRRYFGLFDPAPATMGVVGEALAAAFNPQLAAWLASPFAIEAERSLLQAFGTRFGFDQEETDGTFTSGGAEANHTAVLTALTHAFPEVAERGLRAMKAQPVLYLSEEGHPSLLKSARATGLGEAAVRRIPVDEDLRLDVENLNAAIVRDRSEGYVPFLVVATAGTTSAGAIDPLEAVAQIAAAENLWLHVDAAWGGAAALVPELRSVLAGIERADSITFDPHKLLSVPMGAGLYLTRHAEVLNATFHISASYVPGTGDFVNPYTHSMQWSRRFIGLKVLLTLAVSGWDGYATVLRRQVAMGDMLRDRLREAGWLTVNETALPLICFTDTQGADPDAIVEAVNASGRARIFSATIPPERRVVRAAITNHQTDAEDIETLLAALNDARIAVTTAAAQG
jgi:glutamate/tyrosine decarboxylase-like PLP-dependent enzyme